MKEFFERHFSMGVNYDEEGNPVSLSEGRSLERDLREGKIIPPVQMLMRDKKAFNSFMEWLLSVDEEKLKSRVSVFLDESYWKQFVDFLQNTERKISGDTAADVAQGLALKLKEIAMKDTSYNFPSQLSLARPIILLLGQYVIGMYGSVKAKSDLKKQEDLRKVLQKLGKVIFNDEAAFLSNIIDHDLKRELQ